jgi:hypothetical protein
MKKRAGVARIKVLGAFGGPRDGPTPAGAELPADKSKSRPVRRRGQRLPEYISESLKIEVPESK